jgi:hypothetical protein
MNPEKKEALSGYLSHWYGEDASRQKLLDDIIAGKAGVSLRLMDWFVTNYSARNPVVYEHHGKVVSVNNDYRDALRCFHKMAFDSFRRRGGDDSEEAALRQHNFFKWAITNGVVGYVVEHSADIVKDMAAAKQGRSGGSSKVSAKRRRRRPSPAVLIKSGFVELQIPKSTKLEW